MTAWPQMTLAGGPVQVTDRTLREQSRPVLYHYDPAFIELFAHTCDLLQKVYRTRYDVVIMQGEAILALEAAAACLLSPGDKVLNLVSGVFGKWFELFIDNYGGETIELAVPLMTCPTAQPWVVSRNRSTILPSNSTLQKRFSPDWRK